MDRIDVMLEPLRGLLMEVGAFVPRLLLGVGVLLIGVLVAKAARFAVGRALRAINFHVVTQRAGIDELLSRGGAQVDTSELFARLAYGIVILAALIVAFNSMGLNLVTELLSRVMVFVPRLVVALLIVVFGSYFARFVGNAVEAYSRGAALRDAPSLGRVAHYAVIVFVLMVALDHLDIGGAIVRQAFLILLAGLALALALAFGLGGREWAASHLERWWPTAKRDRRP